MTIPIVCLSTQAIRLLVPLVTWFATRHPVFLFIQFATLHANGDCVDEYVINVAFTITDS